jgi:hypothetical protein
MTRPALVPTASLAEPSRGRAPALEGICRAVAIDGDD